MTDADDSISVSSLVTPHPFADDPEEPLTAALSAGETDSKLMYVSHGCLLKALALLSLGLKNNDGSPTFNRSVLPWSAALCSLALKLTAKDLQGEVTRHSVAAGNVLLNTPHPMQWLVRKAMEWLVANPIVAKDEVAFIC